MRTLQGSRICGGWRRGPETWRENAGGESRRNWVTRARERDWKRWWVSNERGDNCHENACQLDNSTSTHWFFFTSPAFYYCSLRPSTTSSALLVFSYIYSPILILIYTYIYTSRFTIIIAVCCISVLKFISLRFAVQWPNYYWNYYPLTRLMLVKI